MPTDSPPCWLCTSTTRPGIPSSSPVISTHAASASFWPSRLASASTRGQSWADIEALAEPITPIFIGCLGIVRCVMPLHLGAPQIAFEEGRLDLEGLGAVVGVLPGIGMQALIFGA